MPYRKKYPLLRYAFITVFLLSIFSSVAGVAFSYERTLAERLGFKKTDRVVVINGDDAGMCHSVNAATIDALENGLMKSASIMVPCPGFSEIATYARSHPGRDFGVHITLTSEWEGFRWGPVTDRDEVPSLINPLGYFWPDLETLKNHATLKDIENEVRNQIKKALAAGIDITHLDSHMYALQYIRKYVPIYLNLASEFNIPIRLCTEWDTEGAGFDRGKLAAYGFVSPDYLLYSHYKNGESVKAYWKRLLKSLKPGVSELYVHVALPGQEIQRIATRDWKVRVEEYRIFTADEEIRQIIKDENIKTIGYRELRDLQRTSTPENRPPLSSESFRDYVKEPLSGWAIAALLSMFTIGIIICAIPLIQRGRTLAGICLSPGSTLEKLAEHPDPWGAFSIVLFSFLIVSLAAIVKTRAMMNEFGRGFQSRHALMILGGVLVYYFGDWLFKSVFIGFFARAFRKKVTLTSILSIAGYANVPQMVFRGFVMVLAIRLGLGLSLNPWFANVLTLGKVFHKAAASHPGILALLEYIDVFGLWSMLLAALGIKSLFGSRTGGPLFIAVLYWVLNGAGFYIIQIAIGKYF